MDYQRTFQSYMSSAELAAHHLLNRNLKQLYAALLPQLTSEQHLFLIAALPEAIRIHPPPEKTFPLPLQTQPHTGYPVALINHIKMDCTGLKRCGGVCGSMCCSCE